MKNNEFIEYAKNLVKNYAYDHLDISDEVSLSDFDVYVTWYAYIKYINKN